MRPSHAWALIAAVSAAAGCGDATPSADTAADAPPGKGRAARTPPARAERPVPSAADRGETARLRGDIDDLQRRVEALERAGAADAPRNAGATAAEVAAEAKDLRRRLLAGVAGPTEARRFWELLRGADAPSAAAVQASPASSEPRSDDAASPAFPEIRLPLDVADERWDHAKLIADGSLGAAASFDDAAARIDAGACPVSSTEPFTLRARIRTRDARFATALMARDADGEVGLSLTVGRVPGRLSFEAWSWSEVRLTSAVRVDDGAWHEVEVSYDPTTEGALLTIDGVRQDAAVLGPGESLSASLRLGNNIGADQPFRGDLDEVALLRRTSHPEAFGAGATGR